MLKWKILYEDNSIIVVHKYAGIATESANIRQKDLVTELKSYLKKQGETKAYLGVVHRLDQPVEGILVFAKTAKAADILSQQVTFDAKEKDHGMGKYYKALVYGHMPSDEGRLIHYIASDGKSNLSYSVSEDKAKDVKAKKAILDYKLLERQDNCDLLEITLGTGRHHQIRVQFAAEGHPLIGDLKYGSDESISYSNAANFKNVQLQAYRLSFYHPETNEKMNYEI